MAAPDLLDPDYLISSFGLFGLLVIVFAECGLLVGFFLPGDTLFFSAGLLVANDKISVPLWVVIAVGSAAAVAGNLTGYWIGRKAGPVIFDKPDSRIFRREYVERAHTIFERYGPWAVILARFVPVVRTFATVLAGVSRMRFSLYALYSLIGGVLWAAGLSIAGYYLGHVSLIADHVDLILIAAVLGTLLLIGAELLLGGRRNRRRARHARTADEPADKLRSPGR